jgi:hypothetical protein
MFVGEHICFVHKVGPDRTAPTHVVKVRAVLVSG